MKNTEISAKDAWTLRRDMGFLLSPNGKYENSRVKEIAIRQSEITTEMFLLDDELKKLAEPTI